MSRGMQRWHATGNGPRAVEYGDTHPSYTATRSPNNSGTCRALGAQAKASYLGLFHHGQHRQAELSLLPRLLLELHAHQRRELKVQAKVERDVTEVSRVHQRIHQQESIVGRVLRVPALHTIPCATLCARECPDSAQAASIAAAPGCGVLRSRAT